MLVYLLKSDSVFASKIKNPKLTLGFTVTVDFGYILESSPQSQHACIDFTQ